MPRRLLLAVVVSAAVSAAGAIDDLPRPTFAPPLILRLEGVIEPSREAAHGVGFAAVSLGVLDGGEQDERWLAVTDARTVGGDHPRLGKDVLADLAPFAPTLLVSGPPELTKRLRDLPPGTPVRLEGLVDRGSRTYLLRLVEVRKTPSDTSSSAPSCTA